MGIINTRDQNTQGRSYPKTQEKLSVKGPMKLTQRVKIALSFLQSVSNQFRIIILSLPM